MRGIITAGSTLFAASLAKRGFRPTESYSMASILPPGVQGPRKGHLTLTLTWDPSQWSASLWSQRVRVKWWGERGDGQLVRLFTVVDLAGVGMRVFSWNVRVTGTPGLAQNA